MDSAPSCPPNQVNYSLLTDICNLWRNYGDIQDSWSSVLSVLDWFVDHQDILQPVAGPGHWNDPDMVPAWRGMDLLPTALCPLTGRTLRGSRSALKCVLEPGALDSPWDLLSYHSVPRAPPPPFRSECWGRAWECPLLTISPGSSDA